MGKLTLLLVAAASLGGAYLTLNMQGLLGDSARQHAGEQADLLAREIAESGHDLILGEMFGTDGFRTPSRSMRSGSLEGGRYRVAVSDTDLPERAILTARGMYGGAEHVISSEHEFDAMAYPAPIWIDTPYATLDAEPSARVSGGADGPGIHFDRRQNDQYALDSVLPIGVVETALAAAAEQTGTNYTPPGAAADADQAWAGLLKDLNVRDGEELFQAARAATTEAKAGPLSVRSTETWGAGDPTAVTRVDGLLTVSHGGRLSGTGALVVDGGLIVEGNGRLDWVGMVIVRSDEAVMPVDLDGNRARITGALVVVQRSVPPGGHMDVTVNRDTDGLSVPMGDVTERASEWPAYRGVLFPWHQHTHRFDETPEGAPRGKHIRFLQDGAAGPHETRVQLHATLQRLGSQPVYLEFQNPTRHGFAQFELDVDSFEDPLYGSARNGFGDVARGATGDNRFRTQTFNADDLQTLSLNVQALRSLQPAFDGVGTCASRSWPRCIGNDWGRGETFSVVLKKASGEVVYSASVYWHMRRDESAVHEAEEQAWRERIAAGEAYGAHIRLGNGTRVTYNRAVILQLAARLGFEGNRIIKITASHETISANAPGRGRGADGLYAVCHAANNSTHRLDAGSMEAHLGHGDSRGPCSSSASGGSGSGGSSSSRSGSSGSSSSGSSSSSSGSSGSR